MTLVGLLLVGAFVVADPLASARDDEVEETTTERERSAIATTNLTATVEADGQLTASGNRPALAFRTGTVTSVAPVGTPVDAGVVLYELDGESTVALLGSVPAWRDMGSGDEGTDVQQLEANLVALGYDPDGLLTVDETFTDYTAEVVTRWQADVGRAETGLVALGSVVFVPDPGSITSVAVAVGDTVSGSAPSPILTVSSLTRELITALDPADLETIGVGTELSVRFPDRSVRTAEVHHIGSLGDGTWQVTADLADEAAAEGADESDGADGLPSGEVVPVTVTWTHAIATDVKTVRANALTRLDTGTYVVEVVDGGADDPAASTRFVEVGIGERSGSTVAVITDLPTGTEIIAP
ncbi:MAG: peptidoglycan-binding domain-containing protein [Actinomycetota bacterium]